MLAKFLLLISVLFILLAMPFALVQVTKNENRKTPRNLYGIAFYRKYPKLLELRRKVTQIDVVKWHNRVSVFCIILGALTIALSGYYPEETRMDAVGNSFFTLGGVFIVSFCLLSIKRGQTYLIFSNRCDIAHRHKEPTIFWCLIVVQFFLAFICIFAMKS